MADIDIQVPSTSRSRSRSRSRSPHNHNEDDNNRPISKGMELLATAMRINFTLLALCCSTELDAISVAQYFGLILC